MAKTRVESCVRLDVLEFARQGCFRESLTAFIRYQWRGGFMPLRWETADDRLTVTYSLPYQTSYGQTRFSYPILLTYTPTRFQGERPWFWCPLCGRRVRKLYLPWGAAVFGCRRCHDLAYESQRRLDPFEKLQWLLSRRDACKWGSRRWIRRHFEYCTFLDQLRLDMLDPLWHPSSALRRYLAHHPELATTEEQLESEPPRPPGRPREKRPYVRRQPLPTRVRTSESQGWCMRCRDFREMQGARPLTLGNGRPALRGTCPVCKATMTLIVKAAQGDP